MHYTQCLLLSTDEASASMCLNHVAWIPSMFAIIGRRLFIDGLPGKWEVLERYETKEAKFVEPKSRDYLHQREASDI